MKKVLVLSVMLAVACTPATTNPPVHDVVVPGGSVSFLSQAIEALNCSQENIEWSMVEPLGGSVSSAGVYAAPACGPSFIPGTYHVRASGCSSNVDFPVTIAENVLGVDIVCAVVQGTACCATGELAVPPGTQIQFHAAVHYSCPGHVEYHPSAPPAANCL